MRAANLTAAARTHADDPLLQADIDRLRGRIEVNVGSADDAHRIFTQAVQRVAGHDPSRALEMAVAAAVAQSHGADSGATLPADIINVDPSAEDTPSTRHAIAGDRRCALAELHAAQDTGRTLSDLDVLANLANAALHLGDDDSHRHFYALLQSIARENGDTMSVIYALQRLAFGQYVSGQWAELWASSEEAVSLGLSVGQRALTAAPLAWLTLLTVQQGRDDYEERLSALELLIEAHPATTVMLGVTGILVGTVFLTSIFVQTVLGFSALRAGVAVLPFAFTITAGTVVARHLMAHTSPRNVATSGLVMAAAAAALLSMTTDTSRYGTAILPGLVILGIGVGMVFVPVSVTAMAGIPASHAGVASGFLMTGHEVGAALGVAVLSAVATTAGSLTTPAGVVDGFSRGFLAAALITAATAAIAFWRMPSTRVEAGAGMHMHR